MQTFAYTTATRARADHARGQQHTDVGIRAQTTDNAMVRIIRAARREARASGAYKRGDHIWFTLWSENGTIARRGAIKV